MKGDGDGEAVTKRWVSSRLTGEPAAPADFIIQRPPFQRAVAAADAAAAGCSGGIMDGAHRIEQPPKSYLGSRSKLPKNSYLWLHEPYCLEDDNLPTLKMKIMLK